MTHFHEELAQLKEGLLAMASHAESAVTRAVRALGERDEALAQQVQEDDAVLDHFEVQIDDLALHLLAKAPLATELRLITVAMKISQNLERVGDEAVTIARRVRELGTEPPLRPHPELPRMAGLSVEMLREALTAFVERQPEVARRIIPRDREVDTLNRQVHRDLSGAMVGDPATITRCLHLMVISKAIERIADHATNIAEEVVFLYEARDIRHTELKHHETEDPGR